MKKFLGILLLSMPLIISCEKKTAQEKAIEKMELKIKKDQEKVEKQIEKELIKQKKLEEKLNK